MNLFNIVKKALLAGLGAQEKVKELINDLVKKGELSKSDGAKLVKTWTEKANKGTERFSKIFSDMINKKLEKMNIVTKKDVKELNKKIEDLSNMIEKLEKGEKS